MLGFASDDPEMLLNGANPDPAKAVHEPDDAARLKLSQALERAKYAIAWERAWPHLARLLTLAELPAAAHDLVRQEVDILQLVPGFEGSAGAMIPLATATGGHSVLRLTAYNVGRAPDTRKRRP